MDEIKVLWYPQLSTRRGWQFDSNFHFFVNLFYRAGSGVSLMWPKQYVDAVNVIKELVPDIDISFCDYHFPYYIERFFIPWEIEGLLQYYDYDVIFLNEPTHVMTVRAILKKLEKTTPIVTYQHWIDNFNRVDGITYYFRQIEGYYAADLVLVNSQVMWNSIMQQIKVLFSDDFAEKLSEKFRILEPAVREDLFSTNKSGDAEIIFAYADRLSDYGEYVEAFERFMRIFKDKNHKVFNESYKDYFDALKSSDVYYVKITTFNAPRMWSMSSADFIASGNAAIAPRHSCFLEMYQNAYEVLFNSDDELREIISDVDLLKSVMKRLRMNFLRKYSSSVLRSKFYSIVEEVVR